MDSAPDALTSHVSPDHRLEWPSGGGLERDAIVQNRAAILPGRRVGTADEGAQAILMLMTTAYVMGEVVHVEGGGRYVSRCSIDSV